MRLRSLLGKCVVFAVSVCSASMIVLYGSTSTVLVIAGFKLWIYTVM